MTVPLIGLVVVQVLAYLVLLVLGLIAQQRQRTWRPKGSPLPTGVSVILPIKGLDPEVENHWRNWLTQRTSMGYEVIFSLQDPEDPALPILRGLLESMPEAPGRILVNPLRRGLNGKASNLFHGVAAARFEHLVVADADIDPPVDLLERLVPPLTDPGVGVVAALPVVSGATNLPGAVTALMLNTALTMQWMPQYMLGVPVAISGACFAIRRGTLAQIGGFEAFGGSVVEDAAMTKLIRAAGLEVLVGPTVKLHQGDGSWPALFGLASRAAYMAKFVAPPRDKATMVFGIFGLALLAGLALVLGDGPGMLAALGGLAVVTLVSAALQWSSDRAIRWPYLFVYPLMLGMFVAAFARALVTNEVSWRGVRYRVAPGGHLTLVGRESHGVPHT